MSRQKMLDRQNSSQEAHQQGAKVSIHSNALGVDPINKQYTQGQHGRSQQQRDLQKQVNHFVRAQHLQTCSNAGYNIING